MIPEEVGENLEENLEENLDHQDKFGDNLETDSLIWDKDLHTELGRKTSHRSPPLPLEV
jgi:hypothetical protein